MEYLLNHLRVKFKHLEVFEEYRDMMLHYEVPEDSSHQQNHHILPRCLFPEEEFNPDNIIALDIKDHQKAHEILARGTEDYKMIQSVMWFEKNSTSLSDEEYDDYLEVVREKSRERMIKYNQNRGPVADETRQRMSESAKNKPRKTCPHCLKHVTTANYVRWHGDNCSKVNKEPRRKWSEKFSGKNNPMHGRRGRKSPHYGRPKSPEHRKNLSGPMSEETKNKLRVPKRKASCRICRMEMSVSMFTRHYRSRH